MTTNDPQNATQKTKDRATISPLFLLLTIVPFTDKKRFSFIALFIHIYVNWNISLYGCCHANNITCKFYGSHFK